MIQPSTRLRWRRQYRRGKRQVEDFGSQTENGLERFLLRRMHRLWDVRRFASGWVFLLVLLMIGVVLQTRGLSKYYQVLRPAGGGIYTEGVIGSFTNANPLYAVGSVDATVSHLVFSGLMRSNQDNQLVGDLAEKWSVDEKGTKYTVTLRPGLVWHDGKPLTAADVVFTYKTIQNPDARSPFLTSWQGIKVEATDDWNITFSLPNTLSSFPNSLTNGIVPRHLLGSVPASQLRSVRFNTVNPIGSGPFKWSTIEVSGTTLEDREEQIGLAPNEKYHNGVPKIQKFIIRSIRNEKRLLESFEKRELSAINGLDSVPDDLKKSTKMQIHNIPLTGQVVVFLKTTNEVLNDIKVRQALVQAVDQGEIISGLAYPVIISKSPLLPTHVGYDKSITQLSYNITQANKLLDEAGWVKGIDGIRKKGDKLLTFRLYSQSISEYQYVTQKLQSQWRAVGANVEVSLQSDEDLQTTVAIHNYDALLYGISLGVDPDVFPYWHSSQADVRSSNRLNLSEYKSTPADKALEAGRTRIDPATRAIKYKLFLEAWRNDAPAISLYQPHFLYVTQSDVRGFDPKVMNTATDRFSNVQNWTIREEKTNK